MTLTDASGFSLLSVEVAFPAGFTRCFHSFHWTTVNHCLLLSSAYQQTRVVTLQWYRGRPSGGEDYCTAHTHRLFLRESFKKVWKFRPERSGRSPKFFLSCVVVTSVGKHNMTELFFHLCLCPGPPEQIIVMMTQKTYTVYQLFDFMFLQGHVSNTAHRSPAWFYLVIHNRTFY